MLNNLSGICGRVQQRLVNQSNALWFISLISIYKHCAIDTADPSQQYAGHVSHDLHNRPRSLWSLCGSVVEHWSMESKGLRFHSSWGLRIFFFCPTLVTRQKNIFLYKNGYVRFDAISQVISCNFLFTYVSKFNLLFSH